MLDLSSVTAKLGRARYHADAIANQIVPWVNSDLYSLTEKANAGRTRFSLVFNMRTSERPPLQDWSLMAGDCIHNLRCALDHLVYAIAIHESGASPPPCANRLQFPICDDDARFADEVAKNRLGMLSNEIVASIKGLQFYNRRNVGAYQSILPPLRAIRDFNNLDKHKLLRVAFAALNTIDVGLVSPGGVSRDSAPTMFHHVGELKDGTEVFTATFQRPAPDVYFDRKAIEFGFVFEHRPNETITRDVKRSGVTGLLGACIEDVEHIVETLKQKC